MFSVSYKTQLSVPFSKLHEHAYPYCFSWDCNVIAVPSFMCHCFLVVYAEHCCNIAVNAIMWCVGVLHVELLYMNMSIPIIRVV